MPKKKKTNKISLLTLRGHGRLILFVLILLILVAVAVYFSIAWYQGYKFKQVEKKMNKLQIAFVAELGEPLYQTNKESCGYASEEFRRGRLGCGFGTTLYYSVNNGLTAAQKVRLLQQLTRNEMLGSIKSDKQPDKDFIVGDEPSLDSVWTTFKDIGGSDNCNISYYYSKNTEVTHFIPTSLQNKILPGLSNSSLLSVAFSCGIDPIRPIFPVTSY